MTSEALQDALAAEEAAIWGYGVAGSRLGGGQRSLAQQAEAAHRDRRDALLVRFANDPANGSPNGSTNASAPANPAAFELPFPVGDAGSALRLAIVLEEGAARAWRRAIGTTTAEERALSLRALTACAEWATRWRQQAGVSPLAPPFPGDE